MTVLALYGATGTGLPAGEDPYLAALGYGLGGALLVLALHALVASRGVRPRRADHGGKWLTRLGAAVAVATVLVALLLAVSAGVGLGGQGAVAGWPLFVHVGAGGAFLFLLALLALLRSARSRSGRAAVGPLARLAHWLVLLAGLVTGGSMMLATLPVFGGAGMESLLDLHRWSGLALAGAALLLGHGMLLGQLGRREESTLAQQRSGAESRP